MTNGQCIYNVTTCIIKLGFYLQKHGRHGQIVLFSTFFIKNGQCLYYIMYLITISNFTH